MSLSSPSKAEIQSWALAATIDPNPETRAKAVENLLFVIANKTEACDFLAKELRALKCRNQMRVLRGDA